MRTIGALRNELIKVFKGLRDGTIEAKTAVEMNNAAGKIISTVKAQLDYAALRNEMPDISFMEEGRSTSAKEKQ